MSRRTAAARSSVRQSFRAHRGLRSSHRTPFFASAAALIKTFPHWDRSVRLYAIRDNAYDPRVTLRLQCPVQCCDLCLVIISYRINVYNFCFDTSHYKHNRKYIDDNFIHNFKFKFYPL